MRFPTALSIETIIVDGAARQRDDKLSFALLIVCLVAIAMTAEMIAGCIHCNEAVHDGQHDDKEKRGQLHDRNGLIQVGCVWKMVGACGSVDCGNNVVRPAATITRERQRERERERLCFDVLVVALSTQDRKPSTEDKKARQKERKMTARRFREAREIISGCEKHAKSRTPCWSSGLSGRRT